MLHVNTVLLATAHGKSGAPRALRTRGAGGPVGATEVDLAFARAKAKGTRRLDYEQFVDAVADIALQRCAAPASLSRP